MSLFLSATTALIDGHDECVWELRPDITGSVVVSANLDNFLKAGKQLRSPLPTTWMDEFWREAVDTLKPQGTVPVTQGLPKTPPGEAAAHSGGSAHSQW